MTRSQQLIFAGLGALVVYAIIEGDLLSRADLLFFAVLIPSIILHEVSHGWSALSFGDDTAKRAGRLTLNPVAHIDPWGSVILPAILVLVAGFAFGYAKPVPVNPRRMRSPRNHGMLTALAGPATNIVIALVATAVLILLDPPGLGEVADTLRDGEYEEELYGWSLAAQLAYWLALANVFLAAFNLIPIPPLDGSSVIERFLPMRFWPQYLKFRQYSMLILLGLFLFLPETLLWVFRPALQLWGRLF